MKWERRAKYGVKKAWRVQSRVWEEHSKRYLNKLSCSPQSKALAIIRLMYGWFTDYRSHLTEVDLAWLHSLDDTIWQLFEYKEDLKPLSSALYISSINLLDPYVASQWKWAAGTLAWVNPSARYTGSCLRVVGINMRVRSTRRKEGITFESKCRSTDFCCVVRAALGAEGSANSHGRLVLFWVQEWVMGAALIN